MVLLCSAMAGCLATQNDLRVLQGDVAVLRAEAARRDSVRVTQVASIMASVRMASDSLRALTRRMAEWQGDSHSEYRTVKELLIQIQELTGQSQRRLQELRAGLEERGNATGSDSGRGGNPGPNQLLQLALDQLRRGNSGAARAGFTDLLARFPESEAARLGQFYVGESYAAEGNVAAADSVYLLVIARQPPTAKTPTAIYKHALVLLAAGKAADAKAALASVVAKFPLSDEALLAADRLKLLK